LLSWLIPLFLFILVAGITPGPNNIIAMSIGFNFNYKKILPHLFGVAIGFPVMLLLIGFVIKDLQNYENIFIILKYLSLIYLLYFAYKIATSSAKIETSSNKKPITFIESIIFQWINPKAWAGALATVTLYLPKDNYILSLIVAATLSAITIVFSIALWGYIGKQIKGLIKSQKYIKVFNVSMAILLMLSIGLIL